MKKVSVLALLTAFSALARADGLPTIDAVKQVTDGVMTQVASGDIEGGLKSFKSLTIIPPVEFDAMVGQVAIQIPSITARFGSSIGQEFIKEVKVGNSLAELIYINRFDKHAMRWQFYLYRGKSGWVVNTFRFDDKWTELLDRQ